MAISDAVQTLSAAFSFGILLQAASGALFLFYNNHGTEIFQDGRRLVLALFLLFSALWAQLDFVNLLIPTKSDGACQATVLLSTAFDQLARVAVEQFLLWSVGNGQKVTAQRMVLQAVLAIRLVAGGLLVGYTRPEFAPACVATTSLFPIAIVVIALDFIIVGVLAVQALSSGMFKDIRESNAQTDRSKALILSIVGLLVWTGMSVVMILGVSKSLLILRTVLPSNGLLILVGIVTLFSGASLLPRENAVTSPGAISPFMTHSPQARSIFRENVSGDNGSPVVHGNPAKSGHLFVVNPSLTPRGSPTAFPKDGFVKFGATDTVHALGEQGESQQRARGAGYRGSSGVFPAGYQGSDAPNIRLTTEQVKREIAQKSPAASQPKKSLFNWGKQPAAPTVRSLGISAPIMSEDVKDDDQPFARMQTIDLATAASNERERRAGAAARARLIADRPAPRPPVGPEEGLRKSVSLKRKDMPGQSYEPMPTIAGSNSSQRSVEGVSGSTTSASLSPGHGEVRLRSPRTVSHFVDLKNKNDFKPTPKRMPSLGLPSGPRLNKSVLDKEMGMVKQPMVMRMSEIVYDDPEIVQTIMDGAPKIYADRPKTAGHVDSYASSLKSSASIIHRPRPYRKNSDKHGSVFFSGHETGKPDHKRSKSGPAPTARKSYFASHPGSPTELPPLPPPPPAPPTTAANLARLLPSDTKNMTVDEKIEMLFPAPPGTVLKHHRRSSVPSLPRAPSIFMTEPAKETPFIESPVMGTYQSQRSSKRTTIASFATRDSRVPDVPDMKDDNNKLKTPEVSNAFRFSAEAYRLLTEELNEASVPGIWTHDLEKLKKASVYHSRKSTATQGTSSSDGSQDDATTDWGSIHSKAPKVDLSKAKRNASSILIQEIPKRKGDSRTQSGDDNAGEIMTVMLDSRNHSISSIADEQPENVEEEARDVDSSASHMRIPSWHRRIGDELPTFSERRSDSTRSRKAPAPTPLHLNSRTKKTATIVVRPTEPSPADSAEQALLEIQAQLKRFETTDRGSVGSLLRNMPSASSSISAIPNDHNGRLNLLADLEAEMGQQENQWQRMQTNIDRDSMASIISPMPITPPEEPLLRVPLVTRRARIRGNSTVNTNDSSRSQSPETARAGPWQQRLADAQKQYEDQVPEQQRKQSINFFSLSKAGLASPTPPDSLNSASEIDSESEAEEEVLPTARVMQVRVMTLWEPSLLSPNAAAGRMWSASRQKNILPSPEPPAKHMRPAQRTARHALPIYTSDLWTKPASAPHSRPVVGLWGSRLVRPVSIVTRKATQRPQRKSKRVTFLPDIVESPQPLPNKRDTLGIYQYPWGEKSDSANYIPPFNPALLTINPELDARSRELEPEEYSSSFFDDYEDEDEDLDISESDDDFDDNTLFEIASILKSDNVPSQRSLLSSGLQVVNEYDEGADFSSEYDSEEDEEENSVIVERGVVSSLPIQPLSTGPKRDSELWVSSLSLNHDVSAGLPQPEPSVWEKYAPEEVNVVRSKAHASEEPLELLTSNLWSSAPSKSTELATNTMWSEAAEAVELPLYMMASSTEAALMWFPQSRAVETESSGLFSLSTGRSVFRTTLLSPVAKDMIRTPRASTSTMMQISSQDLWSSKMLQTEHHWISESSISPASPSIASSSGRSSPISESSSLKSTSTKASSIWGSLRSAGAANWWETKAKADKPKIGKNSPPTSPIEAGKFVKPLLRKQSKPALAPVRESTVLASRDTWESKAPKMEDTPAKKFRNSLIPKPVAMTAPQKKSVPEALLVAKRMTSIKRSGASPAAWDAALAEAVKLGKPHIQRPVSTQASWDAALLEAVSLSKPRFQPTTQRSLYTDASWKAALAEAIAMGRPRFRSFNSSPGARDLILEKATSSTGSGLQRITATPESWNAALIEAISKSEIQTLSKYDYDSAVLHPVFHTQSMVSSIDDMHPAAIGHFVCPSSTIVNAVVYDSAVLHPVFHCQYMTSSVEDIHPAAIGHVQAAAKFTGAGMWSASSKTSAIVPGSMWTKSEGKRISIFALSSEAVLRKASVNKSTELPILKSFNFWTPAQAIDAERNWLAVEQVPRAQASRAQTWMASTIIIAREANDTMWAANFSSQTSTPDIFGHVRSEERQNKSSARPVALSRLTSTELFDSKVQTVREPANWLQSTSIISTPEMPSSSAPVKTMMWSPAKVVASLLSMSRVADLSSADLFANIRAENKTPSTVRLASLPTLTSSKLFQSKPKAKQPINWLLVAAVPMTTAAPTFVESTNAMWSPSEVTRSSTGAFTVAPKEMFDHIKIEPFAKTQSRPVAALQSLTSTKLFEPSSVVQKSVNWLRVVDTAPSVTALPVSVKSGTKMWSPSHTVVTQFAAGAFTVASTEMFSHIKIEPFAKSQARPTAALQPLNSTELFAAKMMFEQPTHWLFASSGQAKSVPVQSASTYSAPTQSNEMMWMMPAVPTQQAHEKFTVPSASSLDMFSHITHENIKKLIRPAALPRLTSSSLFEPKSNNNASIHWLHSTSTTTSRSPALTSASQTWTAPNSPASSASSENTMWTSDSALPLSPVLFANPHAEPWVRKSRASSATSIASTEMWASSPETAGPMHWLERSSGN